MHVRPLPWRPRWYRRADVNAGDVAGGFDIGDDFGLGLVLLVALLALPFLLVVLVLSLEIALVAVVLPFWMTGQLLGLLPWVLVLRTTDGQRRAVEVRGVRPMLEARRYYRSLRV